jgi:acyl phosphate:glycerol-3-phosphate acyltransferase
MNIPTSALVAAGIAYLVGSLPFGYLVAKIFKGTDIRTQGSGNIGATNVARTLGVKWGILVFILDAVKGFLPVWLLPWVLLSAADFEHLQMHFEVLCGVATVLGHIFPVWLNFKGGKGVATSAGVVLMISTLATLIAVVVYVVMLAWKRIGSLASLAAAGAFSLAHVLLLVFRGKSLLETAELSRTLFVLLMPIVIILCHKNNLVRLLHGEEPKFGAGNGKPAPSNGKPVPEAAARKNTPPTLEPSQDHAVQEASREKRESV